MGFQVKDAILLVAGFVVGIPAPIIAALILGPAMTIMCGFGAIKVLAKLRQRFRRDAVFDREWRQDWQVTSDRFSAQNPSTLKIYRFLHLLAAEAQQNTLSGSPYKFRIIGIIDRNIITGKWMDPLPNGYYGTFQLMFSHTRDEATGKWMGFSSGGTVKVGEWAWATASVRSRADVP
jgi:hypothetical protein